MSTLAPGKFTSSRPTIERMQRIAHLLRAGLPFTAGTVATTFEVDRKTISRDFIFMRDRLGWDFEWCGSSKTYKLITAPKPVL